MHKHTFLWIIGGLVVLYLFMRPKNLGLKDPALWQGGKPPFVGAGPQTSDGLDPNTWNPDKNTITVGDVTGSLNPNNHPGQTGSGGRWDDSQQPKPATTQPSTQSDFTLDRIAIPDADSVLRGQGMTGTTDESTAAGMGIVFTTGNMTGY